MDVFKLPPFLKHGGTVFRCWRKRSFQFRFLNYQEFRIWTSAFIFIHFCTNLEDLVYFILKLSAVILAPTGIVYMLLCNEGRHSEEQRQFDCHKS